MNTRAIKLLAVSHVAALGLGYLLAPKEPVDTTVKHEGYFRINTTQVLATTIESLREENRLLVFSYKGSTKVKTDRSVWWILRGHQELIVPAVVNYYVDLSDLSLANVTFDEKQRVVRVHLPPVTIGDIAFQPENATTINGGILTYDEETVEMLRKLNYAAARRGVVAQAQQPGLLKAAQRSAKSDVESYFTIPLRIAGQSDVKVAATF